jgi:phosphatidylserine/phosphatidylglycerophosphate/cardiolipin synthase-like enzyme
MLLRTTAQPRLRSKIREMYHVKLREIILVSPFLSIDLFRRTNEFGRFLDKAVEDETEVCLITLYPQPADFAAVYPAFTDLEARGCEVLFLKRLHTKLYVFTVDEAALGKRVRHFPSAAIIGSANLTNAGTGLADDDVNEEGCWLLTDMDYKKARTYAEDLRNAAIDLVELRTPGWRSRQRRRL